MVDRDPAWVPESPETLPLTVHRNATDRRFHFDSVEEIFATVENKGTNRVSDTLKNLRHISPTCLKVTLRHARPGRSRRSMMPDQPGLPDRFDCGDDVEGSEACVARRWEIQGWKRPGERKPRRIIRCSPIVAAASWIFRRLSRCFAERVELTYYLRGSASF